MTKLLTTALVGVYKGPLKMKNLALYFLTHTPMSRVIFKGVSGSRESFFNKNNSVTSQFLRGAWESRVNFRKGSSQEICTTVKPGRESDVNSVFMSHFGIYDSVYVGCLVLSE